MITELIRRSELSEGPEGLDIKIRIDNDCTGLRSHPLFLLICQHSESWRIFDVSASPASLAGFSTVRGRLPRLVRLEVSFNHNLSNPHPVKMLDIFEVAPLLKHIHMDGKYYGQMKLPPAVEVIKDSTQVIMRTLQTSWTYDNLTNLDITEGPLKISDEPLILYFPRLTKLKVTSPETHEHSFFARAIFPVLSLLTVWYKHSTANKICSVLAGAISGSGCSDLKELILRESWSANSIDSGPIPDLESVLLLVPHLDRLDTHIPENLVITKLGTWGPGQQQTIVPALQRMTMYISQPLSKSTITAIQRLAHVRAEFWPRLPNAYAWDGHVSLARLSIFITVHKTRQTKDVVLAPIELEAWYTGPTKLTPRLCELAESLRAATPACHIGHSTKLPKAILKELEGTLTAIEATEVTTVNDFLVGPRSSATEIQIAHIAPQAFKHSPCAGAFGQNVPKQRSK